MDGIRNILVKHSGKIKYLFLLGAIIAGFNTLSRADYNFVLYLYMFYVWAFMGNTPDIQNEDKLGTFYLLLYSLFIDIFWCLFWEGKWDSVPTLAHGFTIFFSWIGLILKIAIFALIGILEWQTIKSSMLKVLKAKRTSKDFVPYKDEDQF